jgi:hypothetical protein
MSPTAPKDDRSATAENTGSRVDDRRISGSPRRQSTRIKTLKGAQIVWQGGARVRCVVRNLSEIGACLEVGGEVPRIFDLVLDSGGPPRTCWVVWRHPPKLGVKFRVEAERLS